jgi:hypothetical protein
MQAASFSMLFFGGKARGLRVIVTNWGGGIIWFQRFPKHKVTLKNLLQLVDGYSATCHREVALAKNLGFTGQAVPTTPNSGGFFGDDLSRFFDLLH